MRHITAAALALSLAGQTLAADFEGVIDARMTMVAKKKSEEGGSGTIKMYVGSAGAKVNMQMASPMGEIKMTTLHLKAKPGVSYIINEEKKTYAEVTAGEDEDDLLDDEKVTVKRLPNEKVAGFDCAHAMITDSQGEQTEIWSSKALGGAEAFWVAQTGEQGRGGKKLKQRVEILRENGLDGWPLRFTSYQKKGDVTWETVKVDKRSLPASTFSLAGYTRVEGVEAVAGGIGQMKLSPEQQKKMDAAMKQQQQMQEAMKKMTPEQRKQMEELLKSMGGNAGK